MRIFCNGISHKTAELKDLAGFQVPVESLAKLAARFKEISRAGEAVLVSTCNRVEFYACLGSADEMGRGVGEFYRRLGVNAEPEAASGWFLREGGDAVRHLFQVASGLDSAILGESQILGQLKGAYSAACTARTTGRMMHKLFHSAFHTAKRVHREVEFGAAEQGFAGAACELVRKHYPSLQRRKVLIIGANTTTEPILTRLQREGALATLLNRSPAKAEALAKPMNARFGGLDALAEELREAEIVVSATSAPGFILTSEALSLRDPSNPLLTVDLASPADVDPQVCSSHNVKLFDLDTIKRSHEIAQSRDLESALPYALGIVEEQVQAYESWRRREGHAQAGFRMALEGDRKEILRRFRDGFHEGEYKALDALSKNLMKQFLRRLDSKGEGGTIEKSAQPNGQDESGDNLHVKAK